jgi:hypothetical protein
MTRDERTIQDPAAGEQGTVRCPPGWQCGHVIECEAGAPGVEGACFHLPPQYECGIVLPYLREDVTHGIRAA